jgi:flavin-dependent dehydrogenase
VTRAIVVGASIAGLVAARVLSDRLDEVVVVERDRLSDGADARPGVPQAVHVHVLLRRGYVELTRLFPAFDERLANAGAPAIDWSRDAQWITPAGQAPRFPSTLRSRTASRALFEATIRALTLERANVRLLDGHEAVGLIGDAHAISGVRLRPRPVAGSTPEPAGDTPTNLEGWLVVDASGRGSRTPADLEAVGVPEPQETVIDASLRYATRIYRIPPGSRDWKGLLVRDRPPSGTRGGGVFELEGGRWVVTLGGAGVDQPPTDEAGFHDFARSLISPILADAIRNAEPLTPVRGWARTANRWRHVERMRDWPAGFALAGDAMCALNPVYGQGMSVAALEGPVLAVWLNSASTARALASDSPPATTDLMRRLARAARLPWLLATAEDARIAGVHGAPEAGRLGSILQRYVDEIQLNAARDRRTMRRFTEVSQLVRGPIALFDPLVLWRVATGLARRRMGRPSG